MVSDLLQRLAATLTARNIPYMLIGGQAVLLYGEPRLTKDVDITLGIPPADVRLIMEASSDLGLEILVQDAVEFAARTSVLPCLDPHTTLRVDFIFSWSAYEAEALSRVRQVRMGDTSVCFASPEDVVVHKVIAGRPRDMEDVRGILLRNPELDLAYVRTWLEQFDQSLAGDFLKRLEPLLTLRERQ